MRDVRGVDTEVLPERREASPWEWPCVKASFTRANLALSAGSPMRGWLKKRSPAFHAQMQKRYFVLEDAMLTYYSNEACAESRAPSL